MNNLNLLKLGFGTIWFGQKWPVNNEKYILPTEKEIEEIRNGVRI